MMRAAVLAVILVCSGFALAQKQNDMPGIDMSGHDGAKHDQDMKDMPGMDAGNAAAMHSYGRPPHGHGRAHKDDHAAGPETWRPGKNRPSGAGGAGSGREVSELQSGSRRQIPNLPPRSAAKAVSLHQLFVRLPARRHFDASQPTSLLYEKHGDDYKLIGVMYTAAKDADEDELNEHVPLSIAQWHAHVNLCVPPPDKRQEARPPNAKYGLAGSITTKEDCEAAGGRFVPQIFGWMVHVYPFEQRPEEIWSVERQHNHMD
jgi:hypothetical protein